LEGVSELLDTIGRIRETLNPQLGVEGVVLTMFDDRTNLAQAVAGELKTHFGDRLFTTTIPRNVRLAEAPSYGKPALLYDPRSRGAESYIKLAKEIMDRVAAGIPPMPPSEAASADVQEQSAAVRASE
jgi:chromosome partitioning protein